MIELAKSLNNDINFAIGLCLLDDHGIVWPKKYWNVVSILRIKIVAKVIIKRKP